MPGSGPCECGCGGTTPIAPRTIRALGHVRGCHIRFIRGHNNRRTPPPAPEDRGHGTPCLIWQGHILNTGYGQTHIDGYPHAAHRVAYERAKGPVPPGLHLDHLCRQRECVNPDHLEPVTCEENVRRGAKAKLSHEDAVEIRRLAPLADWHELAALYGVNYATVFDIFTYRSWTGVTV